MEERIFFFSSIAGETDHNVSVWSVRTAKIDQEYPDQCQFGQIKRKQILDLGSFANEYSSIAFL